MAPCFHCSVEFGIGFTKAKQMAEKDARIKLMNEILSGIKVSSCNHWSAFVSDQEGLATT